MELDFGYLGIKFFFKIKKKISPIMFLKCEEYQRITPVVIIILSVFVILPLSSFQF